MTIDGRLQLLLAGSPAPIPALGSRVYSLSAPQRPPGKPYCVYQVVADDPIRLQDNAESNDTRRWHYQFTIWGPDGSVVKAAAAALQAILIATSEVDGIRTAIQQTQRDDWDETERLHGVVSEFIIWEDLPA